MIERLLAGIEHAGEIVERRVRVRAAHRFVQRRDEIVVAVLRSCRRSARAAGRPPAAPSDRTISPWPRRPPDLLGERQRGAAVAIGHADQHRPRRPSSSGSGRPSIASARARSLPSASVVERLEDEDARPRQERGVELEGRVLGRRADQRDRAVLHHRQEGILLRAVEAVDLVDEEERALARLAARARRLEHLLQVGDAGEDRRDLLEMEVGLARQQPRDRRLAGARRPPEDERAERAGGEHPGERAVGPEQVVLADDVGERSGRSRSASGRGAALSSPAASKSDAIARPLSAELRADDAAVALDRDLPDARAARRRRSASRLRRVDRDRR